MNNTNKSLYTKHVLQPVWVYKNNDQLLLYVYTQAHTPSGMYRTLVCFVVYVICWLSDIWVIFSSLTVEGLTVSIFMVHTCVLAHNLECQLKDDIKILQSPCVMHFKTFPLYFCYNAIKRKHPILFFKFSQFIKTFRFILSQLWIVSFFIETDYINSLFYIQTVRCFIATSHLFSRLLSVLLKRFFVSL